MLCLLLIVHTMEDEMILKVLFRFRTFIQILHSNFRSEKSFKFFSVEFTFIASFLKWASQNLLSVSFISDLLFVDGRRRLGLPPTVLLLRPEPLRRRRHQHLIPHYR